MDLTKEAILIKKYPLIFKNAYISPQKSCMAFGCECDNGWFKLLDETCEKLYAIYKKSNMIAIADQIPGISPLLASMTIALCGGLAFMLVIATPGNAITYSSGYFSTRDLFKAGSIANIICIAIIFIIATTYWIGVLHL